MRKLMLALVAMLLMVGLTQAVEVVVVSYDKDTKTLTYKDGDAEKSAKVGEKAKFTTTDFKGENAKEATYEAFEKLVTTKGKGGKAGRKIDITVTNGTITEAKWRAGGKGK